MQIVRYSHYGDKILYNGYFYYQNRKLECLRLRILKISR